MAEDEKWEYYFDDVGIISRISGDKAQLWHFKLNKWIDCDKCDAWNMDCRYRTREQIIEYAKQEYGVDLPE